MGNDSVAPTGMEPQGLHRQPAHGPSAQPPGDCAAESLSPGDMQFVAGLPLPSPGFIPGLGASCADQPGDNSHTRFNSPTNPFTREGLDITSGIPDYKHALCGS